MGTRMWWLLLVFSVVSAGTARAAELPDYAKLRAVRAEALLQPDGWFSLVALEHLEDGDTRVGSAPDATVRLEHVAARLMTLHKAGAAVTVAAADRSLAIGGKPAAAGEAIDTKDEDAAHAMRAGEVLLWVIDRGGQKYLRVKDPQAPERVHFHGLAWYAPRVRYRVEAKWVPYPAGHTIAVTNKLGQMKQQPAPGYAEFLIDGKTERLTPMIEDGNLFFVFRDTTGSLETDGGGRFLTVAAPAGGLDHTGTLLLDFNQAVNPPCAYSPFATCPLAPKENRLTVAIPAGEKRYEADLSQRVSR